MSYPPNVYRGITDSSWVRNPEFSSVWTFGARKNGFTSNGAQVAAYTAAKGPYQPEIPVGAQFNNNYNGRRAQSANLQPIDPASYIRSITLGQTIAGTAQPFTIIWAGGFPILLATGPKYIFNFYNAAAPSTSGPQLQYVTSGNNRSQAHLIRTIDGSSTGDLSSPVDLGAGPNVVTFIYTGSTITYRVNKVTIDNAVAWAGGPTSFDSFLLGRGHNGFSSLGEHTFFSVNPLAMSQASYERVENGLMRYLGI